MRPSVWDVPGGHCELGETPEAALVREVGEELGVTPLAWDHLASGSEGDVPPSRRLPVPHIAIRRTAHRGSVSPGRLRHRIH